MAETTGEGRRIVLASVLGTGLHAVAAGAAVVADTDAVHGVHVAVAGLLFVAGIAAMGVTIVLAANRSRYELIGIGGLFFGAGSAPRRPGLVLQLALGASVVVSIGAAAARPFTPLAFGTLVPLWPLGLLGLWCARHGRFPKRADDRRRTGR